MCWLLCLPFTKCLPGVQCLFIVFMPFLGSMFGPDVVVRLSLILMLHSLVTAGIPWMRQIPFLSTGLMVALVAVPMDLVPSALIWSYSQLLWVSEPLLMMLEAVAVVHFTVTSSKTLVRYIDSNPVPVKSAILGVTFISYVTALALGIVLWLTGGTSVRWVLAIIALISIVLLVTTIAVDRGVISDCAIVSLYFVWCLWSMQQENRLSAQPLQPPVSWEKTRPSDSSVVQVLYSMLNLQIGNISSCLSFLWALLSPTTLVMIVTRSLVISKAGLIVKKLSPLFLNKEDSFYDDTDEWESDDEETTSSRPCCCALHMKPFQSLPLKLAFLFVYTQLIVYNIENSIHPTEIWSSARGLLIYEDLRTLRLLQIGLSGGFYLWSLVQTDEDDEDWY